MNLCLLRLTRVLRMAVLAAAVASPAASLSVQPAEPASVVPVRFTTEATPPPETAREDVAVQMASLHTELRAMVSAPRAQDRRGQEDALIRAGLWLMFGPVLVVLYRAHRRTSQARASGPRPTGEV